MGTARVPASYFPFTSNIGRFNAYAIHGGGPSRTGTERTSPGAGTGKIAGAEITSSKLKPQATTTTTTPRLYDSLFWVDDGQVDAPDLLVTILSVLTRRCLTNLVCVYQMAC